MRREEVWTCPPIGFAIGGKTCTVFEGESEWRVLLNESEKKALRRAAKILESMRDMAAPSDLDKDRLYDWCEAGEILSMAATYCDAFLEHMNGVPVVEGINV